MKNLSIATHNGTPMVQFPEDWRLGWMLPDADAETRQFPVYVQEVYIYRVLNQELKTQFRFSKFPVTSNEWIEWVESYYLGLCCSPFGYQRPGVSHAPWGISVHGVAKLRPDDE